MKSINLREARNEVLLTGSLSKQVVTVTKTGLTVYRDIVNVIYILNLS